MVVIVMVMMTVVILHVVDAVDAVDAVDDPVLSRGDRGKKMDALRLLFVKRSLPTHKTQTNYEKTANRRG